MTEFDLTKKFRFRNFRVYSEARKFVRTVKQAARSSFPEHERFGLSSQLSRALDSVILNVAEGSERGSDKDFAHFLSMANASLNEVVACLDIALDESYVSEPTHRQYLLNAAVLGNHLSAFKNALLNPSKVKGQMSNADRAATAARSSR